jgi:cytochrome c oxidase assembly protein subunit 15
MRRSTDNPWLTRFAAFTALATLCLIGIGGIVTSKGVGMAVPDWPTTYGYNMFLFPISKWVGGVRDEHTHRLFASWVGLLTTALAVWIWLKDERSWMRKLGLIAFITVSAQGVLGGLRVVKMKDEIGIFHAVLAQSFLCLLVAITLFLSRWWQRSQTVTVSLSNAARSVNNLFIVTTILIFLQLTIAASMRHQHAGLAVPDFPLAYGKLWPATDPASIQRYNQLRVDDGQYNPITARQIYLHMTHRFMAILIFAFVAACWTRIRRTARGCGVTGLTTAWLGLITLQASLGIVTVLKNKPADIATAHVIVGAASLAMGALISIMLVRLARQPAPQEAAAFKPAFADSRA